MRFQFIVVLCAFASVGCGGSVAEPSPQLSAAPAPVETAGDEVAALTEPVVEEEPEAAEEGPASFSTRVTVGGQPAAAQVRVLAGSEVVAEGDAGASLSLPSGSYRLEIEITDAAVLFDKPKQSQPVTLAAGSNPAVVVDFPVAKVQLNVLVNGKSEANATVKLKRRGAVVGELKSGAAFVPISPGRYDAEVLVKGHAIEVTNLLFPEGATQTVPVAVKL